MVSSASATTRQRQLPALQQKRRDGGRFEKSTEDDQRRWEPAERAVAVDELDYNEEGYTGAAGRPDAQVKAAREEQQRQTADIDRLPALGVVPNVQEAPGEVVHIISERAPAHESM